jgi:hypothetical protein
VRALVLMDGNGLVSLYAFEVWIHDLVSPPFRNLQSANRLILVAYRSLMCHNSNNFRLLRRTVAEDTINPNGREEEAVLPCGGR